MAIESGTTPTPRIETVRKIANALGVSIDDFNEIKLWKTY
jgi:transcriptional regulator with XRE-family HTH domain